MESAALATLDYHSRKQTVLLGEITSRQAEQTAILRELTDQLEAMKQDTLRMVELTRAVVAKAGKHHPAT